MDALLSNVCTSTPFGKFDTLEVGDDAVIYYCAGWVGKWRKATDDDVLRTYGIVKDGEIKKALFNYYKYDEGREKWQKIDKLDTLLSFVCTSNNFGKLDKLGMDDSVLYICGSDGWEKLKDDYHDCVNFFL